jgi:WD40 repeat protein
MRGSSYVRLNGFCLAIVYFAIAGSSAAQESPTKISFYKQIRPVLQAHCHGCHQPARAGGDYVMTDFKQLHAGGESEAAAIVVGKPDESYLLDMITPTDGEAEMPKGKKPLAEAEIELIRTWISEGAEDDTPAGAIQNFDSEHPPIYTLPSVITSLDFSPDGKQLAVAGFHEVLITDTEKAELSSRLIGVSERIESVQFSPDGNRLLVTGGLPCRMGEVQVWDVASRELLLSVPLTYDTLYGGSWSPDGKLIAFGCADNTLRAIDAETGEQVLFQGAHNDWVRDTVFTKDGKHLISVGRDMTCKLTEVATERFVDNITSITPGVLKGGVNTVARHPERDEIVVGGADGVAKVYRVFRLTARRIGDDANLIRRMPGMRGRIFDVAVSGDGRRIAAVSSLDGGGQLHVYSYEFDTALPEKIKNIQSKTVQGRSAEEKQLLLEYQEKDVKLIAEVSLPESGLYSVTFSPDGKLVAAAGADGLVRLIESETGRLVQEISPAPITSADSVQPEFAAVESVTAGEPETSPESLASDSELVELIVQPSEINLSTEFAYSQLVVTGRRADGASIDVTRLATTTGLTRPIIEVSPTGFVRPLEDGEATLSLAVGGLSATVQVRVSDYQGSFTANFIRDVNPVLSRVGCNLGTCHGSAKGKNGFKLSLRGYDPILDTRALTDDLASRRTNLASPDDSLMLLKATGAVPHVGAQVLVPGEPYYRLIRDWIASGAKLDRGTPRVTSIEVSPQNPIIEKLGGSQQIRVVAFYSDGEQRDVTREAFVESGDMEIAAAGRTGLMTALRRGEAPILARYEGAYAATTLTVMGDRDEFVWREPETWGEIDKLAAAKWQRMKIQPSGLCTDSEFIRRVYIDLIGLPPSSDEVQQFLADQRETRIKRTDLVNRLIGDDEFIEYWTNKWADLLQVNRKYLGAEGAADFRKWIRAEVAGNTPYDEFARKILTASGSNKENPAAAYFKILRDPDALMENTTHLFLAVRFNCNKCHDHPFERWTQDQYYETAAFFARVGLKADPASGKRKIGGTAVEGAKPFYEVVYEKEAGEVTHNRTGAETAPEFPFECDFEMPEKSNRRDQLAAWITSPDNPYFAKSYVNRLWGYLLGAGIIEPIDDLRASNPATNPELIDYLTREFIRSGFDARYVMKLICESRTYQLSIATNRWNEDDSLNYSHAKARRLPAEVLYDSIYQVTGSLRKIPGVPPGTRAAALPDSGISLPDGFLANLGRPPRESACECERGSDLQLGPVMALIGGPTVANAIADPKNEIAALVSDERNDARLVNEIFLRIMNRSASADEVAAVLDNMSAIENDHQTIEAALAERQTWWKEEKPLMEQRRIEAIAKAKAELVAYEKQIAPRIEAEEKKRTEAIAKRQTDLDEYLAGAGELVAEWEKTHASSVEWHPLETNKLSATEEMKLLRQADRSIRATGEAKNSVYTLEVHTRTRGITGIRIEALPDADIKGGGPGLEGGNFVLSEFKVSVASKANPEEFKPVELRNALADFSQANLDVGYTIDGKIDNVLGWGVKPAMGTVHWATFETKEAVGFDDGTVLKFELHHNRNKLLLGRFRISVTTDETPIGLSLPESLKMILATAADHRDESQKDTLNGYFANVDKTAIDKKVALTVAQKPLPEDRGITERKQTLAAVSEEIKEDGVLVQLQSDLKYSTQQVANKRLTAAQDLAWALINNPAFLFNR